jgi:Fur family transcriptional regulator, peroxide stress response regulator
MELPLFVAAKIRTTESLCRSRGIPLTVQRRTILEILAARTDHPTADQIYDVAKDLLRGVSRTTVYRVLETFVRLEVVSKVSNPQAKTRFDADTSRHHHLICLKCDTVADYVDDRLNGIELPAVALNGFAMLDYSLSITGICDACSGEKARGCP